MPRALARPPFKDIVCAVDGSRGSSEAVEQAIALCGPTTRLSFVAIGNDVGEGLVARADLGYGRAGEALEEAAALARQAGLSVTAKRIEGAPKSDLLLEQAAGHDLLALGCHGGSRIGGIMLGSTATQIAHRAAGPVLVARRSNNGPAFPQDILLATDGSPGSWAAMEIATRISQARRSELRVVHVPDGVTQDRHREILKQLAEIEKRTGAPAAVIDYPGPVAGRIAEAARASQSSLIVIGRRGLRGIRALGSVSERVVHRASCSVLAVPAAGDAG